MRLIIIKVFENGGRCKDQKKKQATSKKLYDKETYIYKNWDKIVCSRNRLVLGQTQQIHDDSRHPAIAEEHYRSTTHSS